MFLSDEAILQSAAHAGTKFRHRRRGTGRGNLPEYTINGGINGVSLSHFLSHSQLIVAGGRRLQAYSVKGVGVYVEYLGSDNVSANLSYP